jgi:hypothetical protein
MEPTLSPDGKQIAYSAIVETAKGTAPEGRLLELASGHVSMLPEGQGMRPGVVPGFISRAGTT